MESHVTVSSAPWMWHCRLEPKKQESIYYCSKTQDTVLSIESMNEMNAD